MCPLPQLVCRRRTVSLLTRNGSGASTTRQRDFPLGVGHALHRCWRGIGMSTISSPSSTFGMGQLCCSRLSFHNQLGFALRRDGSRPTVQSSSQENMDTGGLHPLLAFLFPRSQEFRNEFSSAVHNGGAAEAGVVHSRIFPRHLLPNIAAASLHVEGRRSDFLDVLCTNGKRHHRRRTATNACRELCDSTLEAARHTLRLDDCNELDPAQSPPTLMRCSVFVRCILEQVFLSLLSELAEETEDGRFRDIYPYDFTSLPAALRESMKNSLAPVLTASSFSLHIAVEYLVQNRHPLLALEVFSLWWWCNGDQFPVELPLPQRVVFDPWHTEVEGAGAMLARLHCAARRKLMDNPALARTTGGILSPDVVFPVEYQKQLASRAQSVPYKKYLVSSALFPRLVQVALSVPKVGKSYHRGQELVQQIMHMWVGPIWCAMGAGGGTERDEVPSASPLYDPVQENYGDWLVLTGCASLLGLLECHVKQLRQLPRANAQKNSTLVHRQVQASSDRDTGSVQHYEDCLERIQESFLDWMTLLDIRGAYNNSNATGPSGMVEGRTSKAYWARLLFVRVLQCVEETGVLNRASARRPATSCVLWCLLHRRMHTTFPHVFHAGNTVSTLWTFAALEGALLSSSAFAANRSSSYAEEEALQHWKDIHFSTSRALPCREMNTPTATTPARSDLDFPKENANHSLAPLIKQQMTNHNCCYCTKEVRRQKANYIATQCAFSLGQGQAGIVDDKRARESRSSSEYTELSELPGGGEPVRHSHARLRRFMDAATPSFSSTWSAPSRCTTAFKEQKREACPSLEILLEARTAGLQIFRDHASLSVLHPSTPTSSSDASHTNHNGIDEVGEVVCAAERPSMFLFVKLVQFLARLGEPSVSLREADSYQDILPTGSLAACLVEDIVPNCHSVLAGYLRKLAMQCLANTREDGANALLSTYRTALDALLPDAAWEKLITALLWSTIPWGHRERGSDSVCWQCFGSGSLSWSVLFENRRVLLCPSPDAEIGDHSLSVSIMDSVLSQLVKLCVATNDSAGPALCLRMCVEAVLISAGTSGPSHSVDPVIVNRTSSTPEKASPGTEVDSSAGLWGCRAVDSGEGYWQDEVDCDVGDGEFWQTEAVLESRKVDFDVDPAEADVRNGKDLDNKMDGVALQNTVPPPHFPGDDVAERVADAEHHQEELSIHIRSMQAALRKCPPSGLHLFYSLLEVLGWTVDAEGRDTKAYSCPPYLSDTWCVRLAHNYHALYSALLPPHASPRVGSDFSQGPLLLQPSRTASIAHILLHTCPDTQLLCMLLFQLFEATVKELQRRRPVYADMERGNALPALTLPLEQSLCQLLYHNGLTAARIDTWRNTQHPVSARRSVIHHLMPTHLSRALRWHRRVFRHTKREDIGDRVSLDGCQRMFDQTSQLWLLGSLTLLALESRALVRDAALACSLVCSQPDTDLMVSQQKLRIGVVKCHPQNFYVHAIIAIPHMASTDLTKGRSERSAAETNSFTAVHHVILPSQQLFSLSTSRAAHSVKSMREVWSRHMTQEMRQHLRQAYQEKPADYTLPQCTNTDEDTRVAAFLC